LGSIFRALPAPRPAPRIVLYRLVLSSLGPVLGPRRAAWPLHDSRKAAGESGIRRLSCPGRSAPAHGHPPLIPCGNLSDAVSAEVVTLGQDREPGVPVMILIPLDLQRRFEQRWAARFCRPAPPAAPQSQPQQQLQQQLSEPAKAKRKTRRVKSAGLRSAPAA
jgi:hypothetical protein